MSELPPLPPLVGEGAPGVRHLGLSQLVQADGYDSDGVARIGRLLHAIGLAELPTLPTGLFAANPDPGATTAYTGYGNTWVRDTVHVAAAAWEAGRTDQLALAALRLVEWYASQADRFDAVIDGTADRDDPMQRPHIRFDGKALVELDEPWPHIQNDAHGYALWLLARAGQAGHLELDDRAVGVMARIVRYLAALPYHDDRDSGHWEEQRRLSSASIGAVVAGLSSLRGLIRGRERRNEGSGRAMAGGQDLDALIAAGREVLDRMLPWETKDPAHPERDRRADASMLFLIHPLRVVGGAQADAILADVAAQLTGPYGVRRYVGDSYWSADYARTFDEDTRTSGFFDDVDARDSHLQPGSEAQWCLFDPVLSTIWGWRYLASRDPAHLERQWAHLNRALSHITGEECRLGAGLCPESYYVADSGKPNERVVNDATPLLWTQSMVLVAMLAAERSAAAAG